MLEDRLYCVGCETDVQLIPTEGDRNLGIQFACECDQLQLVFRSNGTLRAEKKQPENWTRKADTPTANR